MPSPQLKSLADKAGVSMKKAEVLWNRSKKAAEDAGRKEDWPYIVGIWKKMAGVKESFAEGLISLVINGHDCFKLIEGISSDMKVRAFYDSGYLCLASADDILLEPTVDSRIEAVLNIVNEVDWPVDHELSNFEFEGTLSDLYSKVIKLSGSYEGCEKSKGRRKAQRTKMRRA